jgi:hypothetical protein
MALKTRNHEKNEQDRIGMALVRQEHQALNMTFMLLSFRTAQVI